MPSKSENPESLRNPWKALCLIYLKLARIRWENSTSCFIYNLYFKRSMKENCVADNLLAIWDAFVYKINCNFISCKLVTNWILRFFLLLNEPKQEENFKEVGGLVRKNAYLFM